jgi:glycosyltransferase involved in cell wall biosynthesis
MEVHQFHPAAEYGDAITNHMIAIRDILRKEVGRSEIYAFKVEATLKQEVQPLSNYFADEDAVLFVHHSMGFDGFERVVSLQGRKVLVFHNITPERFFADPYLKRLLRLGWKQLADFRPHVDYAIAASNFNRREMQAFGYRDVAVMPVQTDLKNFMRTVPDPEVLRRFADRRNILFVGRVVPNKCHEDIIKAFAYYRAHHAPDANLHLVGNDYFSIYVRSLRELVRSLGISDAVHFTGKISANALKAYFETASLFLCMSEHEGYCVPLLEAMASDVPIIAYRTSAVPETLGGAGLLVDTKDPMAIGELIHGVLSDSGLVREMTERQRQRMSELAQTDTRAILTSVLDRVSTKRAVRTLLVEGTFEDSYSLSIVNRKQAEALHQRGTFDVGIRAFNGLQPYTPNEQTLADKPLAKQLWQKSRALAYPDVAIRFTYPPQISDMRAGLNLVGSWGWEESHVPRTFVESFNRYADGIGVLSNFVKDSLVSSGCTVPVQVVGCGVELPKDYAELTPFPLQTTKSFRFLHISSAFPRKGVDVLIKGYFEAFTGDDSVTLVIKTFPNPHNETERQLEEARAVHRNPPEVILINRDMAEPDLYSLYKAASCYVHTARGEGFGLPVAEAMLARIPVIVCPNTGLADFCDASTAMLVGYEIAQAQTHLTDGNSTWAEPKLDELIVAMRSVVFSPGSLDLPAKIERAYQRISRHFTWDRVAERWEAFIAELETGRRKPRVAMVTTWGSRCGIAEYARFLVDATRDRVFYRIYASEERDWPDSDIGYNVARSWMPGREGDVDRLIERLKDSDEDFVHFQYNFGFFEIAELCRMIEALSPSKRILVTFHSTKNRILPTGEISSLSQYRELLLKATALFVHQDDDIERLYSFGLGQQAAKVTQGNITYPDVAAQTVRERLEIPHLPVLASFGFLLPHKGVLEIIQAIDILRCEYPAILFIAVCAIYPNPDSQEYFRRCAEEVQRLGLQKHVVLVTEFLNFDECMVLLQAADLTAMPYHYTAESSSAAVRFCLASGRPLITSKQQIFAEVAACAEQIDEPTPEAIAAAVRKLLRSPGRCDELIRRIRARVEETSWERVGADYVQRLNAMLAVAGTRAMVTTAPVAPKHSRTVMS